MGAELGLAAGALDEDDEPAGGLEGGRTAEVLLDEREREIHPGRHAGRGPHVAVADVDRLGVDLDRRVAAREIRRRCPVRGGSATVEQARLGKHVGARADRGDPPRARGGALDPTHEALVLHGLQDAVAARHEERVDRATHAGRGAVRHDREPAAGAERAVLRRDDLDAVLVATAEAIRAGEDLERTGHVEGLDAVEGEYHYAPHGAIMAGRGPGSNDKSQTISATTPPNGGSGPLLADMACRPRKICLP